VVDLSRLREVLDHRAFRRLLAVRTVGQAGDGLLQAALATFVLFSPERAPTAGRVALSFAILLLPYSVLGPFLGILIDRWSRRSILSAGNLTRAGVAIALFAVLLAGRTGATLALVVLVALGLARFVLTTLAASLPHTVAATTLVTANALTPMAGTISSTVGGLLGVGLRQVIGGDRGSSTVVAVAVAAYLVAAWLASGFEPGQLGPDEAGDSPADVVRGLVDGWRHLVAHRMAGRGIAVVTFHRAAFGALTAMAVIILRTEVYRPGQTGPALLGIAEVTASAAIGAFSAALCTPGAVRRFGIPRWTGTTMFAAAIASPIGIINTSVVGLLGTALFIGFAGQAVKVSADTVVQQQIDDVHRGRVFSIYDMSVNVGLVLGVTAVAVATGTGRIPAYVAIGVGILLACGAGLAARTPNQPG
jgi:MFS family permease